MSLLSEAMVPCVYLNKSKVADGYGGYIDSYTEGVEFLAAFDFNNSLQGKIAEKDGVTDRYTVTTLKEFNLVFNDVFKRSSDGKIFRVTTDGTDKRTPASAGLNMRQVSAELFSPSGSQVVASGGNGGTNG